MQAQFLGNLAARTSGPDDQNGSRWQLLSIAVIAGVYLEHIGRQCRAGEWNGRPLVRACGNDDAVRFNQRVAGL